jgi:hypothetical protein
MGDLKFPATKLEKFKNDLKEELEIRKKLKLAATSYYKKAYSDNPDYNVVRESYFSVINFFPALKGFSMDHVKQAKYKYNLDPKRNYEEDKDFAEAKKMQKKYLSLNKGNRPLFEDLILIFNDSSNYDLDNPAPAGLGPPVEGYWYHPSYHEHLSIFSSQKNWDTDTFINDPNSFFQNQSKMVIEWFTKLDSSKQDDYIKEVVEEMHLFYPISDKFEKYVTTINRINEKSETKKFKEETEINRKRLYESVIVPLLKRKKYLNDQHLHALRIKKHETTNGYIYILSNKSFPTYIKIGSTMKDPKIRAAELTGTGVPFPYEVKFKILTKNCEILEKKVHAILEKKRVDLEREFFECSVEEAKKIIEKVVEIGK